MHRRSFDHHQYNTDFQLLQGKNVLTNEKSSIFVTLCYILNIFSNIYFTIAAVLRIM